VRTKAANKPFEEDLEDCSCDQGVEQTDDGIVDVPEGTCGVRISVVAFEGACELTDAKLHAEYYEDWDYGGEECSKPNGNDLVANRVCKLRIDNLTILEVDGERPRWGRVCLVDTKANSSEDDHCQDVKPCESGPLSVWWKPRASRAILEPLSKAWSPVVTAGVDVEPFPLMAVRMRAWSQAEVGIISMTMTASTKNPPTRGPPRASL